jgi:hypothetical protein
LGQRPLSLFSAQEQQKVHSKVQIMASGASGGRSLSQHSQLGRSSSMEIDGAVAQSRKPARWAVGDALVNPS